MGNSNQMIKKKRIPGKNPEVILFIDILGTKRLIENGKFSEVESQLQKIRALLDNCFRGSRLCKASGLPIGQGRFGWKTSKEGDSSIFQ